PQHCQQDQQEKKGSKSHGCKTSRHTRHQGDPHHFHQPAKQRLSGQNGQKNSAQIAGHSQKDRQAHQGQQRLYQSDQPAHNRRPASSSSFSHTLPLLP